MFSRWHDALGGDRRFAEFLPDAEGMIERVHSPLAGVLILTVATAFGGMLAWSALAEVEQVVHAAGKVEPASRVKVINHPDGGRIAQIHVREGQKVAAGEPLVTFDSELVLTELAELRGRWEVRSAEASRLAAELSGGEPVFDPEVARPRPDLVEEQTSLLDERRRAQGSRTETLAQTVERRASEIKSLAAELARLRNSHALLKQQYEAVLALAEKGLYPRLRLVAVERQLSDLSGEIVKGREGLHAAEAALAEAESRREGLEREWRSTLLAELANTRAERDRLAETLKRQRAMLRNLIVLAPDDGIVQDLLVTSAGQSVGSNQPLMKVVPTGGGLVIEARVDNQDIGYVQLGQPARVKVRAFDFLRYGALEGRIERIAPDANADPRTGALTYEITIRTERAEVAAGEERFNVVPGMAVDVDLLVGERTILSYLTDRIFRVSDAAFRQG